MPIRIIYHDSTEHPATMTITQVQENSELVISQSINLNDLQYGQLMTVLVDALAELVCSDTKDDGYGGATYIWEFEEE